MKEFDVILQDPYTECDAYLYTLLYVDFCYFDAKLPIESSGGPVTLKKILCPEKDIILDIKVPTIEPLKTVYEQVDERLDIHTSGKATLTYINGADDVKVPVVIGDMNLLYRRYGSGDEKLSIEVNDVEAVLYHLFHTDTELLRMNIGLTEDSVALTKFVSGEATLPFGVLYRKARLDDYNEVPLQVLGASTLGELSRIRLRTVVTMYCEPEPMCLAINTGAVDAVLTTG